MNRRMIVVGTAAVAGLVFAAWSTLYNRDADQQTAVAAPEDDTGLVRSHSPVLGPAEAPVTIVEFFDPACEACRAFHPIVKRIMDDFPGEVRVVMRYAAFHKGSDEAVRILETARLQGKFEPVLEALLEAQPVWAAHGRPNLNKAWAAAGAAGLDIEEARNIMLRPDISATLNLDADDVKTFSVNQTPTFFVNGKPLTDFGPQQLYDLVRQQVEVARAS